MDFRAVLILCLLAAQADCRTTPSKVKRALNSTIQDIQTELQTARKHLIDLRLHHTNSCTELNNVELGGPEEQPTTMLQLSYFKCYMLELSKPSNELTVWLQNISQFISSMESLMGSTVRVDCKGPDFENGIERFVYIDCLLNRLDMRISKIQF
ncbi:hypothetical protein EXN66_Car011432 [Channa argus]|uniref:Uncharacterized protein n=1 Tax=Channa argus TaxID=215402 RepID=A0A6G1Q0L2_CHAAH|nr:hypothetical protein EXN66_Car011432 [Channa argus]KAK2902066.1 hypothetical protein Q8A73_011812 [Channa argus]